MQEPVDAVSGTIKLRLGKITQLLDPDPSPFHDGALTPDAESYILRETKKLPNQEPIRIVVGLPSDGANPKSVPDVANAISKHFRSAAKTESQDLQELFRNGRKALLIGFVTLSACLFLAWHFSYNLPQRPITRLMQESFVILGWVSMWRPIEIFLYDWLPLARRRRLFGRLSDAAVIVEREPPAKR